MLPAVVSKMACTGCDAAGTAGLAVEGCGAVLVCAVARLEMMSMRIAVRKLRMVPPGSS
jgi:hypothetical protein